MTTSSPNFRLLRAAQNGYVSYTLAKEIAAESTRSVPELLDDVSYLVARRYSAKEISFEDADAIINALWSICVSEEFWADHDRTIPTITNAVYLAFDAGEYRHTSDPASIDPEVKYTRSLIDALIAEHSQP
jgi:hypothetical protein